MRWRFKSRRANTVMATGRTTVIHHQTVLECHRQPRTWVLMTGATLVRGRWMVGGFVRGVMTAGGLTSGRQHLPMVDGMQYRQPSAGTMTAPATVRGRWMISGFRFIVTAVATGGGTGCGYGLVVVKRSNDGLPLSCNMASLAFVTGRRVVALFIRGGMTPGSQTVIGGDLAVIHLLQRQPVRKIFVVAKFTSIAGGWMRWIGAQFAFSCTRAVMATGAGATAENFAVVDVNVY